MPRDLQRRLGRNDDKRSHVLTARRNDIDVHADVIAVATSLRPRFLCHAPPRLPERLSFSLHVADF